MLPILLLTILAMDEPAAQWKISSTGVFQPLDHKEVLVRDDGGVYILNFADALVTQYDAQGKLLKTIGGKGKGPGEFTYPVSFFYQNKKLYVFDVLTVAVSVFDDAGKFEKRIRVPDRNLELVKIKNGWLYADWDVSELKEKPQVYWADETFSETKAIVTVPEAGYGGGMSVTSDGTHTEAKFSPISNQPMLVASADGKGAWLSSISSFELKYIDGETRSVTHTISRKEKRIPFDVEAADEKLAERIENMERKPDYKIQKMYPEYYPIIRKVLVDPNNHLIVDRWRGRPDGNHYALALDKKGNEVSMEYDWETFERLVGIHKGYAYITILNEEAEEAGLAKVSLDKLAEFAKANPINYEGSYGRSISISN